MCQTDDVQVKHVHFPKVFYQKKTLEKVEIFLSPEAAMPAFSPEALLMAASEELRGGLMRLKEATDEAADADASVEDQDQQVPWAGVVELPMTDGSMGLGLGLVYLPIPVVDLYGFHV